MHKRLLLILFLSLSIMVVALLGCGGQSSSGKPSTSTVLSITKGDVFIMKAHTTTWVKAQVGVTLEADDTIKAGDDSWAMITFFEGSTIELEPGTEVSVATLNITDTGSTTIGLEQEIGRTVSRVKELADPSSSYEVNTPTGVAAVRGSVMLVDVAEDGTTIVGNGEGSIAVIAQGVEVQIPQGMQSVVAIGQPPSVPEQGLPFVPSGVVGNTVSIITSAGMGGSISPSGSVTVSNGTDQTFTITSDTGHHVVDVLVDGVSVGAVTSYIFSSVSANHIISATFAINTYTISTSAGTHGSISPSENVTVNYGAEQAFTITPDTGYHVNTLTVDGSPVTPAESYTFSTVTANHSIAATFAINTYTISTTSLPNGDVNVAYSQTLHATGGSGNYTWSIFSGSLPSWAKLDASTGAITGTPDAAATTSFTVQVNDSIGTATQSLSITINAALSISTTSLPNGDVNVAYSQTLHATGGSGNYTWSIFSGSLPSWAKLDASTGAITGTPDAAATTSFTVQVNDSIGTATQSLSITINAAPKIIYVNVNASGTNDGTSWTNAYTDLQSALNHAVSGDQIWVAEGIYKPSVEVGGSGDDRYNAFQMKNGVAIYGGFAGTENSIIQRDWANNVTTLSGDIGVEGDSADNCYHVIYNPSGSFLDISAILDGFTITGGNADGASPDNCGGGMYNYSSSPAVTNCTFSSNSASPDGGGMYIEYSSPILTNCTFSGNSAEEGGGILCKYNSSPTITNCIINNNSASWSGGGIECDWSSSPTISNCMISHNSANYGGGMQCNESSPVVINCIISHNTSNNGGGGINNDDASSTFINCTITGNNGPGGGLHSGDTHSSVTAVNCIIWGNTACEVSVNPTCYLNITYSDVQGGYDGTGNINADPILTFDLQLQAVSPCIDMGNNAAVSSGTTDFEGNPRIMDGNGDGTAIIDMGADEY